MENSFFEFRNETEIQESSSDEDVIDNSKSEDDSYQMIKTMRTPMKSTKTIIMESDDDDIDISVNNSREHQINTSKSFKNSHMSQSSDNNTIISTDIVIGESDSSLSDSPIHKSTSCGIDQSVVNYSLNNSNVDNSSENTSDVKKLSNVDDDSDIVVGKLNGRKKMILSDSDDDDDNDELVLAPSVRMSLYGVRPRDMPSDESLIQSDDNKSVYSSKESLESTSKHEYQSVQVKCETMSPDENKSDDDDIKLVEERPVVVDITSDVSDSSDCEVTYVAPRKSMKNQTKNNSTDKTENTMSRYIMPSSYPNSKLLYVTNVVKQNEINKLETMRSDLHKLKYLIDNMEVEHLPDNGVKLAKRLSALEANVKEQAEKVASMIVEPVKPTKNDLLRDGFHDTESDDDKENQKKGLNWDQLRADSERVQPKMFGKQAMNTHMAERSAILERLGTLHSALESRPSSDAETNTPSLLVSQLMQHQRHALTWMQWREKQHPSGGILADDMGLGKTLTVIALVAASKEQDNRTMDSTDNWYTKGSNRKREGGTLVICPASLVRQWCTEVEKHTRRGSLTVHSHHGVSRHKDPVHLIKYDIVVTTYNIVQRDNVTEGVTSRIKWSRVVLDEAHTVRNHKTGGAVAVCQLEANSRWALTGTPVHNKDIDLYALVKFIRCDPFHEITMWKKWIDNKSAGGRERLAMLTSTLVLRRTKAELMESGQMSSLPKRNAETIFLKLSTDEMNVYQKVLVFSKTLFGQYLQQRAERQANQAGGDMSSYERIHQRMVALHGAKSVKSHEILVLLLRLRQLCCHCGLVTSMLEEVDDEAGGQQGVEPTEDRGALDLLDELNKMNLEDELATEPTTVCEESSTVADAIKSVLSINNPVFRPDRMSAKINAVMKCLNEKVFPNKDDKAVVVSQWTSVLALVERQLKKADIKCVKLTGSVPVPQRGSIVNTFNDPYSKVKILLLSLSAGGVGLNLCGGNHLLLLDPHWNPQLEAQAQDRIYRVGQTKPVHIYRFITLDTVEQSIQKLQENKLTLAESVLTGAGQVEATKLSIQDLKSLFNMN